MIYLLLLMINNIICLNILKNPSFEEVDSNNKAKYWDSYNNYEYDLSSDCYSGEKALHWKPKKNQVIIIRQFIDLVKDFRYRICFHYKLKNIYGKGFHSYVENRRKNENEKNEEHYFNYINGTNDWKEECIIMGKVQKPNGNDSYIFGVYTHTQENNENSEVFVDDVSLSLMPEMFQITINNDRDEVYDNLNIVYQINTTKGNYLNHTLNDWIITTKIKDDNNNTIYENKINKIDSSLFTNTINIQQYNLIDNKIYQIEAILNSKKDDIEDIWSYPFKKIKQIKREVTFDKYGRMFINNELFFPFGIFASTIQEHDLIELNKTHLNFIMPYQSQNITKEVMDMIYTKLKGRLRVMYSLYKLYDVKPYTQLCEEENYKNVVAKINEFKNHPALFAWYINDEIPEKFNKYLRNITLAIHELDPNHPSATVICYVNEIKTFINTTDLLSLDKYPLNQSPIRTVFEQESQAFNDLLYSRPSWPVIQIYDQKQHKKELESYPPSLQEMINMSWQAFISGAKGIMYYSYSYLVYADYNKYSPFEERWRDVIELTDGIWKYKDIILSIENINKVEYIENPNVKFKQWKYNGINYIVIVNLERFKETFQINILNENPITKEFGLGNITQSGSNINISLEPIDVIMIKYSFTSNNSDNSQKSNLVIIIPIIIISIIIIILLIFLVKKYIARKKSNSLDYNDVDQQFLKE